MSLEQDKEYICNNAFENVGPDIFIILFIFLNYILFNN